MACLFFLCCLILHVLASTEEATDTVSPLRPPGLLIPQSPALIPLFRSRTAADLGKSYDVSRHPLLQVQGTNRPHSQSLDFTSVAAERIQQDREKLAKNCLSNYLSTLTVQELCDLTSPKSALSSKFRSSSLFGSSPSAMVARPRIEMYLSMSVDQLKDILENIKARMGTQQDVQFMLDETKRKKAKKLARLIEGLINSKSVGSPTLSSSDDLPEEFEVHHSRVDDGQNGISQIMARLDQFKLNPRASDLSQMSVPSHVLSGLDTRKTPKTPSPVHVNALKTTKKECTCKCHAPRKISDVSGQLDSALGMPQLQRHLSEDSGLDFLDHSCCENAFAKSNPLNIPSAGRPIIRLSTSKKKESSDDDSEKKEKESSDDDSDKREEESSDDDSERKKKESDDELGKKERDDDS